jgi:hypothetical protein
MGSGQWPGGRLFATAILVGCGGSFHLGYQIIITNPAQDAFLDFVQKSFESHYARRLDRRTLEVWAFSVSVGILIEGRVGFFDGSTFFVPKKYFFLPKLFFPQKILFSPQTFFPQKILFSPQTFFPQKIFFSPQKLLFSPQTQISPKNIFFLPKLKCKLLFSPKTRNTSTEKRTRKFGLFFQKMDYLPERNLPENSDYRKTCNRSACASNFQPSPKSDLY